MGWDEYFVRKGHPVYVPDQVGRGRSGFNQAIYNDVRAGSSQAANQPVWLRFSDEVVWPNFRFGSKAGQPYADSQFPVSAVDELAKQGVPDMSFGLPRPNPTFKALSDLATELKGAVLIGHSQSGAFPLEAALLNPTAAKGLVLIEPGGCPGNYTEAQIKTLAAIPVWPSSVITATHRRHRDSAFVAALVRQLSGAHRTSESGWRSGEDAQPVRDRHPRQQPHDHAGQEQPADRRSDPAVDRRAGQQARGQVKNAITATGALVLALLVARPFAAQQPRRGSPWNCRTTPPCRSPPTTRTPTRAHSSRV